MQISSLNVGFSEWWVETVSDISVSSVSIFVSEVYRKRIVRSSVSDTYQRKSRYMIDTHGYMLDTLWGKPRPIHGEKGAVAES